MTFLWGDMLWFLLAVPVFVLIYLLVLRRKKKGALRYANLSMVKAAMGAGPGIRRHIPPTLFLIALTVMILSMSRPAAVITLPSQHKTVVLVMDVSGSMRATDVDPSRITASQAAAKAFVTDQPRDTRIGIVAFSATAMMVQVPTQNHEDILSAIDRFQLQRGTAVGSGILVGLQTIFPDEEFDLRQPGGRREPTQRRGQALGQAPSQEKPPHQAVPPGSHPNAVIIVLTDGQTNTGADPIEAARTAADYGVRVFTVGFGSPAGAILGFEGRSMRVQLDEESLKTIADLTRGAYFRAGTEADLQQVYENLSAKFTLETKETEITAIFSAVAVVLALLSAMLSLMWYHRIV